MTVHITISSSSGNPSLLYNIYPKTSRILDLILDFPPVGSAKGLLQTKHLTVVETFPKMICSFLHLGHLTLINFDKAEKFGIKIKEIITDLNLEYKHNSLNFYNADMRNSDCTDDPNYMDNFSTYSKLLDASN